jgi:drug/metabolite transporter (DMT)-like permease
MDAHTRGLLSMFCAALCFSATSVLIRIAPNIDPFKSSLFRFAIGMALLGTAAMCKRIRLEFTSSSLLLSRGFIGGLAVYIFFWSINVIGLGKGTLLSYTYPVFAAIWGVILLGEKVSAHVWGLIGVAFCGFFLISMGRGEDLTALGLAEWIALGGSMLSGLAIVIVRKLRATESSYAIFFSQCVIGFWLMLIPANLVPAAIGISGGFILLGIGVSAAIGQILMTYSYKALSVSQGSVIALVTPVANILIGVAVFGETVTPVNGLGMFLVLAACTLIGLRK